MAMKQETQDAGSGAPLNMDNADSDSQPDQIIQKNKVDKSMSNPDGEAGNGNGDGDDDEENISDSSVELAKND